MTTTYLVVFLSAGFLIWWLAGSLFNRRRGADLVKVIRADLPVLGEGATIRWFGSSAFQIDLGKPARHLARLQILGILEARDIPLIWLYWRLRGRRDQLLIHADFQRPPRPEALDSLLGSTEVSDAVKVAFSEVSPHLRLTARVQPGEEAVVKDALLLVARLASESARNSA